MSNMQTLHTKLGIQAGADELRTQRLRWYGHVASASSCTNSITSITSPGGGRPRKSWSKCVKADVDIFNLESIHPESRVLVRDEQANCSLPQELGNYLQSKYQTRIKTVTKLTNVSISNSIFTPYSKTCVKRPLQKIPQIGL